MGDFLRNLMLLLAVAAYAAPAVAFDGPTQKTGAKKSTAAEKQQKEAAPEAAADEKGKAAALVQQAFEGGIKAYGSGKFEEAQRAFDAAVRGGLPSAQMPRLLYYRGLTFRKLGKPGYAVSDLTNALWLKGGLSEAERADATKVRALAYNESGVSDVPPVPQSAYAEAPKIPSSTPAATQTAMAGGGGSAAPASNAPAAPTPSSSSSGGIGGFFSNLFGGSSSEEKPPEPPTSTASLGGDNAPPPDPAASGWGAATEVVAHGSAPNGAEPKRAPHIAAPFVTQVASVDQQTSAPAPPAERVSAPSGKFRLQVAAVRSRSEAEALAGLLVGRHADQLGGRHPEVDESVIGSMGTFYRVRLGPYANAKEPEQLCAALRSDGFDCLVLGQ
jgi:tetratricopeptide (TPR) repeat protein